MNIDSDSVKLISLLREVDKTRLEYELAARLTGENFNVFEILRLSASEVRTHSAFIAELLDPNGSHGQGGLYLKLFLKQLNITETAFVAEGTKVIIEYPIGTVDPQEGTGGRIDILLKDRHGHYIVIENKIYAVDQPNQLHRYHEVFPTAPIYYLTLNNENPSAGSLGLSDLNGDSISVRTRMDALKVECISYREHISHWLEACHKASVSLPVVRETIFQYENLIKKLTNQATGDKVKDKIKEIICKNPDLAEAVASMGEAWQEIFNKVKSDCNAQMSPINDSFDLKNGIVIKREYDISDKEDGVFIGFRAIKNYEKANIDVIEEVKKYKEVFKNLHETARVPNDYWNVGLFNPKPFELKDGFENLKKTLIVSLLDAKKLNEFATEVVNEANDITKKLLCGIGTPVK